MPSGTAVKASPTTPLGGQVSAGRINLPIGMILRNLPQEVLASDLSEFEASGAAATEIGLPMNMILSQLPSGKIEIALSDLVPHFPAGYLQPTQSIAGYLPNLINLPLMDVVMRIPPDLMALRPDQKDVDAAVINMADPFTEEILREQAEAARRQQAQAQAQANIIDENQVAPTEEFVPREQPAPTPAPPKTIAPPPRPSSVPIPPMRIPASTPAMPPAATPAPAAKAPPAQVPSSALTTGPVVPSGLSARTISPTGRLPAPSRATTAIPTRPPAAVTSPIEPAPSTPTSPPKSQAAPPVPPVPRETTTVSVTATQRPVPFPPQPSRPPLAPPTVPVVTTTPPPPTDIVSEPPPAPVEGPAVSASDAPSGSDDLQRLAALAMAELGDDSEPAAKPVDFPESAAPTIALPTMKLPSSPVPLPDEVGLPSPSQVAETVPLPSPVVRPEPEAIAPEPPLPPPPALVEAPPVDYPPVPAPEPPAEIKAAPTSAPVAEEAPTATPAPEPSPSPAPSQGVAFNLNTCTADDLVRNIPGCFRELAESIVRHRTKIGSFKRLEDLLDVPGITKAAYTNLTGETPPENRIPLTLNELLGFPADQHITLKDVTERITCWPDVTGCILSQSTGLSLVGTVPEGLSKDAIVAFAPRMFEALNKSFQEITGRETDELVIPAPGNSFHIFRNKDLYLIILSRTPQMPERHMKVARFVLAALSIKRD